MSFVSVEGGPTFYINGQTPERQRRQMLANLRNWRDIGFATPRQIQAIHLLQWGDLNADQVRHFSDREGNLNSQDLKTLNRAREKGVEEAKKLLGVI